MMDTMNKKVGPIINNFGNILSIIRVLLIFNK
jgi:hypothetical protein